MGGYRDIMRAPELQAEYNKFIAWRGRSRSEKQALYKSLNVNRIIHEKEPAWIAPFGQPAKSVFVPVQLASGTTNPVPTGKGLISGYFLGAAPTGAGDTVLSDSKLFPKNKLAKIVLKARGALREGEHKSRITGREYKRYESNSVSLFIGKAAAADDYSDAVKAITAKPAYKTFLDVKGNTIKFIPEG